MNVNNLKLTVPRNILIFLNIVASFFALLINILSNALPLNGKTAGQISDSLYNYFAPAGYVFAIWFIIYIGWFALIYYSSRLDWVLNGLNIWFFVNLVLNGSWLLFWQYGQYWLSVITMIGIFLTLALLYTRLEIGKKVFTLREIIFIQVPISIYFGWISVALIANITAYLVSLGVTFHELDVIITGLIIFIATVITLLVLKDRKDIFFALVTIWALIGIFVKQSGTLIGFPTSLTVAYSAVICVLVIAISTLYIIYQKRIEVTT